jgi:hypothetical protein
MLYMPGSHLRWAFTQTNLSESTWENHGKAIERADALRQARMIEERLKREIADGLYAEAAYQAALWQDARITALEAENAALREQVEAWKRVWRMYVPFAEDWEDPEMDVYD